MSDILTISSGAVSLYQRVLSTISDNIANVGNPDFVRQDASIKQSSSQFDGRSYQGSGAIFNGVHRQFDEFIESRLRQATSDVKSTQITVNYANQILDVLGGQYTSLSSAVDKFFAATSALSSDPAANSARMSFLTAAEGVASRAKDIATNFKRIDVESQTTAKTAIGRVNVIASQLALVNGQLMKHQSIDKQPASLLNQRDGLLRELTSYIDFQASFDVAGTVKVSLGGVGSGGVLVDGIDSQELEVRFKDTGAEQVDLILDPWGQTPRVLSGVSGGEYGGIVALRDRILEPARSGLDSFIKTFANEVNKIHASGVDGSGKNAGNLFNFVPNLNYSIASNDNSYKVMANIVDSIEYSGKPINMVFDEFAGKAYTVSFTGPFKIGDKIQISLNGQSRVMTINDANPTVENVIQNLKTFIDGDSDVRGGNELGFGAQLTSTLSAEGELVIRSSVLKDYNIGISVMSNEGLAQLESTQGLWIVNDAESGTSMRGANNIQINGLSINISGSPKNGDQITISSTTRPAEAMTTIISDPLKVATTGSFGVVRGTNNISNSRAVIEDVIDNTNDIFTERVLGVENGLSNNSVLSAAINWEAGSVMPVSVIPAGLANLTYYLDPRSGNSELQIFTKNGRHLIGKSMSDGQLFVSSTNAFNPVSKYSDAYIDSTYRGLDLFYGARSIPTEVNPIGADHLPRSIVKIDAKLLADFKIPSAGISAIPAGALTLNGQPLSAYPGGDIQSVVDWLNSNAGSTGILASNDNGYISMTRPANNGDGEIYIGFGNYTDVDGTNLSGTPQMLAQLGFRTSAQIKGNISEDLVVFVMGQGTAKVGATWEGHNLTVAEIREQARQNKFEIQFTSSSHYVIKDLEFNQIVAEKNFIKYHPIEINGLRVYLDDTPDSGDTFLINGNQNASGDNSTALRLKALQNSLISGVDGQLTISESYFRLIDKIGTITGELQLSLKSFQSIHDDAIGARESVSGVNLDEEAASLIRFQQAYQAAAKSMQIANKLFESLIQI